MYNFRIFFATPLPVYTTADTFLRIDAPISPCIYSTRGVQIPVDHPLFGYNEIGGLIMRLLGNFTLNLKLKGQGDPQGRRKNLICNKTVIKSSPIPEPAPSSSKNRPRQHHDIDGFVIDCPCLQQILAWFKNPVIAGDEIFIGIDQTHSGH